MNQQKQIPTLSILIPTKNRLEALKDAIASIDVIYSFPAEIIVTDNASSDGTKDFLERYQSKNNDFRYIRNNEDLGMVGNWNIALSSAQGKYIYLLCDDDISFPQTIEELINLLEMKSNCALAFGSRAEVREDFFRDAQIDAATGKFNQKIGNHILLQRNQTIFESNDLLKK